jgi:hypothetical protein
MVYPGYLGYWLMVNISYCVDNEIAQSGMEKEYEVVFFSYLIWCKNLLYDVGVVNSYTLHH